MLRQLHEEKGINAEAEMIEDFAKLNDVLADGVKESASSQTTNFDSNTSTHSTPENGDLIGELKIPSISLRMPILEGTSKENLDYAVGHMSQTAHIGEVGNAALAAHRGYSHGRLFNRLDEVEKGNEIIVTTRTTTYHYRVKQTFRVTPSDTTVLSQPQEASIITLITCDPIKNPTHRLIVQAELIAEG
ncbi:class D sortase [Thalassobacillus pellis]|uniref:class D sortase n=1 Tax=Thalassobacillus pellis TaxID=748008 RepID=UPI00195FE5D8|nr:class D sortase [Thalassobacillus pellis]MBM7553666.1 sortase A [Thalassobacillus pellis]